MTLSWKCFYEEVVERLNTRKNARELPVKKEIFVLAMSSLKRSTNQSTREGATGRRHALTGSSAKSMRNVLHATTAAPGSPLRHRSKYELRSISLEGTKVLPWTARWVEILYFLFVCSFKLTPVLEFYVHSERRLWTQRTLRFVHSLTISRTIPSLRLIRVFQSIHTRQLYIESHSIFTL